MKPEGEGKTAIIDTLQDLEVRLQLQGDVLEAVVNRVCVGEAGPPARGSVADRRVRSRSRSTRGQGWEPRRRRVYRQVRVAKVTASLIRVYLLCRFCI